MSTGGPWSSEWLSFNLDSTKVSTRTLKRSSKYLPGKKVISTRVRVDARRRHTEGGFVLLYKILMIACKKAITRSRLKSDAPVLSQWMDSVNEILSMEKNDIQFKD